MRNKKVLTVFTMVAAMTMTLAVTTFASSSTNESGGADVAFVPTYTEGSYGKYLQEYVRASIPSQELDIPLDSLTVAENVSYENVDGRTNVLVTGEDSVIEFVVDVPTTGMLSLIHI